MKKLTTSVAELRLDEEGVLHVIIQKGVHFDMNRTKEYFRACEEILEGKKALVLLDAREEYTIADDVRSFLNSENAMKDRIAVAYVTGSAANALLFNFFSNFSESAVPRKMFANKTKALKWLHTFFILPGDRYVKRKK